MDLLDLEKRPKVSRDLSLNHTMIWGTDIVGKHIPRAEFPNSVPVVVNVNVNLERQPRVPTKMGRCMQVAVSLLSRLQGKFLVWELRFSKKWSGSI